MGMSAIRTRWAAIGAAVAVSLGAGGIGISQAITSSGEMPIFLPIEPCRLADLRPGADNVGTRNTPLGADETYTLSGWGTVGDCVLPSGTTALSLNVTAVNPTLPTFLTLFPADSGLPLASHLNPSPGQPPTPNAVNVDLDASGEFNIYNLQGTVDVIIDVVGLYDDHDHDDRYYTETESNDRFLSSSQDSEAAVGGGNGSFVIGSADQVIASVKVDTPTTGYVIVNASATGWNATADGLFTTCSISESLGVAVSAQQNNVLDVGDRRVYAGTRGFVIDRAALSIGPNRTYNYVCDTTSIAETFGVLDPYITAIFIPDPDAA